MINRNTLATAAVAGLVALGAVGAASLAQAQPAAKPKFEFEKCFGVSKAGKNDCQTMASSCAGTSKTDAQSDAWVYVPKGTCDKIVGGHIKHTG